MVHLRINGHEPNPNPHVNFITVLPLGDPTIEEAARKLLRALAAQVKPVMKAHGLVVNSLEEYEYNRVFAGRNWNHGETIELVLRSSTGSLLSTPWLMGTLCHELAHIKHMNHGSAFQALWRQLRQEVRALQNRGYYGDGYWSSGTRLVDSAKIAGQGIEMGELPEYMCGGAHSRSGPVLRRSRKPKSKEITKKRKAGSRVNASSFNSTGKTLNEDRQGESKLHGTGFRKQAGSRRAREERALAAEQRIRAFQGKGSSSKLPVMGDDSESEDDKQGFETDYDRRRALLEVIEEKDLNALRAATLDPMQDFLMPDLSSSGPHGYSGATDGAHDSDSTSTFGTVSPTSGRIKISSYDESSTRPRNKPKMSQSKLTLVSHGVLVVPETTKEDSWDCMVCTLANESNHLACSACGMPRGESSWAG